MQVLISRHESKKKNKEKVQKGNSPLRVKGAKGELQRRAIPGSTKSYSPSTRQRRTKGEQLAKANRRRAPKASNSQRRIEGELQRRAIPGSTKSYSPSTCQRRATRNGKWLCSRGELGRLNLLRADVSQTQWWSNHNSPWRVDLLARRAKAEQKSLYKPTDPFIKGILVSHIFIFCNSFRERNMAYSS